MAKLRIIYVPVGLPAEVREIEHTYDAMVATVGGLLELVELPGVDLWCNDGDDGGTEPPGGGACNLPLNRLIPAQAPDRPAEAEFVCYMPPATPAHTAAPGTMGEHRIHGNFFLTGRRNVEADEELAIADVTDEQIATWLPRLNAGLR